MDMVGSAARWRSPDSLGRLRLLIPSRKALYSLKMGCPYRKPTQVGTLKSEKVFETTLVKELGKMTP